MKLNTALAAVALTLETLAARWIDRAPAEAVDRIMRALALAKAGAVTLTAPGVCEVRGSEKLPYRVTKTSCTCPDHTRRGVNFCKHRLAVSLLSKAGAFRPARAAEPQADFLSWARAA